MEASRKKQYKELTAGLNDRQIAFAREYLIDFNRTQAAKRAGYSEKTAYSKGQQLLKKVEIMALVDFFKEEKHYETKIERQWQLDEMLKVYNTDLTDVMNRIKFPGEEAEGEDSLEKPDFSNLTDEERRLITGYQKGKYGWEIQFLDKKWALESLAKHIGFYEKDKTLNVKGVNIIDDVNPASK